ncbi:hypothetical protein [Dyella flagellata]|uniref:Lipoprotein n=1 Tax=Dyella flagellata TaxID=1867833 RepID=A0ABQ5X6T7_9GAMM|nr:hypothetical protein [Dyella flagellata]GLQ87288.1 hypothetical protein GCM10007898_08540 [Dyella flagellata]
MKQTFLIVAGAFTLLAGCTNPRIIKVSDHASMPLEGIAVTRPDVVIQHEKFPGPAPLPQEYTDAQSPKLIDLLDKPWLIRN